MIRLKIVFAVAVTLAVASGVRAETLEPFPASEPVQSLAYKRATDFGAAGFQSVEAGLSIPTFNPGVGKHYLGAVGMTNFAGRLMIEVGGINTCQLSAPGSCNVRPFGVVSDTVSYQRTIIPDVSLAGGPFIDRVEQAANGRHQALWCIGPVDCRLVIDGVFSIDGFPYGYTRAASNGPRWWKIDVDAPKWRPQGFSRSVACYTVAENMDALGIGSPFVSACDPFVVDWSHYFAYNVNVPSLQNGTLAR